MTGIDSNLGAKIVQNIEIMEGATTYVDGPISTTLSKEVARIFGSKQKQFGWEGEQDEEDIESNWIAPAEWMSPGSKKREFDLRFKFGATGPVDDINHWLSHFCGVAGTGVGVYLVAGLTATKLKALIKREEQLPKDLLQQGLKFDADNDAYVLPVRIDRDALAQGFADEDLEAALAPFSEALEKLHRARATCDRFIEAIRGN
ncbi:hypothetical protein [Paracoccus marcusii]|uniref:hypothetical protein n=1 Tax=Paracoccus marcusii TaxID=59779 RepID=UPI003735C4A4